MGADSIFRAATLCIILGNTMRISRENEGAAGQKLKPAVIGNYQKHTERGILSEFEAAFTRAAFTVVCSLIFTEVADHESISSACAGF